AYKDDKPVFEYILSKMDKWSRYEVLLEAVQREEKQLAELLIEELGRESRNMDCGEVFKLILKKNNVNLLNNFVFKCGEGISHVFKYQALKKYTENASLFNLILSKMSPWEKSMALTKSAKEKNWPLIGLLIDTITADELDIFYSSIAFKAVVANDKTDLLIKMLSKFGDNLYCADKQQAFKKYLKQKEISYLIMDKMSAHEKTQALSKAVS
ncbi:hypothetical protein ACFLZV_01285, partial [Candidatus Margulisiibacteriota bacterium]